MLDQIRIMPVPSVMAMMVATGSVLTRKNMPHAAAMATDPEWCMAVSLSLCNTRAAIPEAKTMVLALNSTHYTH